MGRTGAGHVEARASRDDDAAHCSVSWRYGTVAIEKNIWYGDFNKIKTFFFKSVNLDFLIAFLKLHNSMTFSFKNIGQAFF